MYILQLDGPALAWEYLRRNPDYVREWQRHRRLPRSEWAWRWGLYLPEDPMRDAREVLPDWLVDPDRLVLVHPDDDPPRDAPPFRLWRFPGRKRLVHDGRRLLLGSQLADHTLRLAISPAMEDGMAYAYAVRAGARLSRRWHAVQSELAVLAAADLRVRAGIVSGRPGRASLLHMQGLQALDGVLAGASQRKVAEVLFGSAAIAERWHADSELRAYVRRLIRRGRRLVQGDYRQLLAS